MKKDSRIVSTKQINDDLMVKRNHVEIINTIKKGNEDVKDTVNKIMNFIQSDEFALSIKKSKTLTNETQMKLDKSFENEKIQKLDKTFQKEKKQREALEKTFRKEKAEKEHYEENIQTLERQLKNLKDILQKEKNEIEKLKNDIEKAKNHEEERDVVNENDFELIKNSQIIRNSIINKNTEKNEENFNNDFEIGSSYMGSKDIKKKNVSKFKVINSKKNKKNTNNYNFEEPMSSSVIRPMSFLSCSFVDNKNKKKIQHYKIEKNEPIKMEIFFFNDGRTEWPKDSILKCINNDTDIYFLSQKLSNKLIQQSKKKDKLCFSDFIQIYFKNYHRIEPGKYTLEICLYSDLKGKIGNKNGIVELTVE